MQCQHRYREGEVVLLQQASAQDRATDDCGGHYDAGLGPVAVFFEAVAEEAAGEGTQVGDEDVDYSINGTVIADLIRIRPRKKYRNIKQVAKEAGIAHEDSRYEPPRTFVLDKDAFDRIKKLHHEIDVFLSAFGLIFFIHLLFWLFYHGHCLIRT